MLPAYATKYRLVHFCLTSNAALRLMPRTAGVVTGFVRALQPYMPSAPTSTLAAQAIMSNTPAAIVRLNQFSRTTLVTRGGRIGSGMGALIEALWGFYLNGELAKRPNSEYEMAWMYGHEYNDFACVLKNADWDPATHKGELLRAEVKSMVASADESKAHFDRLQSELDEDELLAVFLWDWIEIPSKPRYVAPAIADHFIGTALPVARLRDLLHLVRGGSFVQQGRCPDGCPPKECMHVGEPLNSSGVRERRTGPNSATANAVSYAANFGGLLRMLGTRNDEGRAALRSAVADDATAARFVDFMARNFARIRRALD